MNAPQVIFLQVKTNTSKLQKISDIASTHFQKKETLLFLVPDDAALDFVDALLWKFSEESFLPHSSSDPKELILICKDLPQQSQSAIFNLTLAPLINIKTTKIIYEWEDLTSLDKKNASQKRYEAYRETGFPISLSI